jgi:hypothetical protein
MIFLHDALPNRTFDTLIRRATGVPANYDVPANTVPAND